MLGYSYYTYLYTLIGSLMIALAVSMLIMSLAQKLKKRWIAKKEEDEAWSSYFYASFDKKFDKSGQIIDKEYFFTPLVEDRRK